MDGGVDPHDHHRVGAKGRHLGAAGGHGVVGIETRRRVDADDEEVLGHRHPVVAVVAGAERVADLDARYLPVLPVAVGERAGREQEAHHREHVRDDDQPLQHAPPRPTCLRVGHRGQGTERPMAARVGPSTLPAVARLADQPPLAVVGERLCTDLVDVTDDPACLDGDGFWAVVVPYEGSPTFARFATIRPARPWRGPPWVGPPADAWCRLARPGALRGRRRAPSGPPSRQATCTR